jgi:membrane protein YdbS with pleckstrin-like domain
MLERLFARVESLLKIPRQPDPPAGSPDSTRVFRAARGFYYRRLIEWGLAQWGAFLGIFFGLTASGFIPARLDQYIGGWIRMGEGVAITLFVVQLVLSLIAVKLGYRLRWYIVTDRSLRIREGIWKVREQTVSFANIQNVAVRQGPLQRALGIADVEIRTAGGGEGGDDSGKSDNLHRAVFRGVDNAAEIRDLIRRDLRRLKATRELETPPATTDSDLEAEPGRETGQETGETTILDASRQLADAARDLRAALTVAD